LNEEEVGKTVLDSAFKVHTVLGPGLLESAYESALAIELAKRGLNIERQKPISVEYEGHLLDVAFRADLIANGLEGKEFFGSQSISEIDLNNPSFPSRPSRDT
jgi:hypothetical protein